uniref:Tetratricopeptide TPR_4 n=1 Tax=Caulobacter sp. (strain K31) TaxID=366602 RepID=B0T897_CAUSK
MILLGLSLIFSIALCVHVVRTGQQMYWLMIILLFQPLGGLVYLIAIVAPNVLGGAKAQKARQTARQVLDPQREYREAGQAVEDAPTVANRTRLAVAASGLGRHAEAERLYAEALRGLYADDPQLLLGRANALIELGRSAEALPLLESLSAQSPAARTPNVALAMGRAYHAVGRQAEADTALRWAAAHLPGFEGMARYAVFLADTGRKDEARETLAEIDKRLAKTHSHFRKEARGWRDLAAGAVG